MPNTTTRRPLSTAIVNTARPLPPTLSPNAAYLGPPSGVEFTEKYQVLRDAGQVFSALAKRAARLGEFKDLMIDDADLPGLAYPFWMSVKFTVNQDGLLSTSDNPLLDALNGVRADRIRSCAVCKRIFWAPRVNSECCCETCRKTFNQRNSREARRKGASRQKHRSKKGR